MSKSKQLELRLIVKDSDTEIGGLASVEYGTNNQEISVTGILFPGELKLASVLIGICKDFIKKDVIHEA